MPQKPANKRKIPLPIHQSTAWFYRFTPWFHQFAAWTDETTTRTELPV